MIKIFRMNTGSCGTCDAEIQAAVYRNADFTWAGEPSEADVLLLTGVLTSTSRPAFLAVWNELSAATPVLAIGRCAIDGHPFGRGGLAELPEISVAAKVDGCPPDPQAIAAAIRSAATQGTNQPARTRRQE